MASIHPIGTRWSWSHAKLNPWPLYKAEVDGQVLWVRAPSSTRALQCALIEFDPPDCRIVVKVEVVHAR